MTQRERQGWIIVAAIFVTMFFIWGAINSGAVFFVPVLKTFGWSRAKLSVALSIGWVTGGVAGPLIGWIADRVEPKKMMAAGAAITGLLYLALSRATTFGEFLLINGTFGVTVGLATSIPCSLVIAGWFQQQRGLAMGIAFSGMTLGGAAMTIVSSFAIQSSGWRTAYVVLAMPILLAVVPAIVIFVRARQAENVAASPAAAGSADAPAQPPMAPIELPGLEIAQAFRTRSMWLISLAWLFTGWCLGMGPHYVAYLTGVGYAPNFAATAVSLFLVATTAGTLLGGPVADRMGARSAMVLSFSLYAIGMVGLLGARNPAALGLNIVAGGFAGGALTVQMPLIIIDSLGVRRLGSMMGLTGVFLTAGAAVSPIVTGRIFDVTGSYSTAIICFIAVLVLSAFAIAGCRSLDREQARFAASEAAAA